jgi:autotransporter-associated beta strand protein
MLSLAFAQTWDGGAATGNWGDALNWNTNTVPVTNANVTFSGTVQTVIDLQSNRTVGTLNFNATADPFTLNNFTLTPTTITNNSLNNQTINSHIQLTGNRTFNAVTAPLTYNGNIHLSNTTANRTLTLTGASHHTISGTITNGPSTASNLTKTGSGTLTLTGSNTYSGNTTLTAGTLALGNNNALGTSTLILNGGTLTAHTAPISISNNATLAQNSTIAGTHAITINGTTTLNANRTLTNHLSQLTLNNVALSNNTSNRTLTIAGTGHTTISGAITNGPSTASNLTKTGSGTLTLTGNIANTYSGNTLISAGTVILDKTAGTNAIAGNITIQSAGTLLLAESHQINNSSNLTLAGGIFGTQGNSEALGTLTLNATSTIDLGHGSSILQFANSTFTVWQPSAQLQIQNWSGLTTGGGTDQIYFGNSNTGLNASKLGQIQFINPAGFAPGTYGAKILSTGEVVPVPEPASILTAALLLIFCLFRMQRKNMRGQ